MVIILMILWRRSKRCKLWPKNYSRGVTDCYKNIIFPNGHGIRIQKFSIRTERCSTSYQLHSRTRWLTLFNYNFQNSF